MEKLILIAHRKVAILENLHNRASGPHFRHHASSAPHVDGGAVVPLAKQQFWWTVPGFLSLDVLVAISIPERHDSVGIAVGLVVLLN